MRKVTFFIGAASLSAALGVTNAAHAVYRIAEKESRDLSLAAGISEPSATSAVYENPAGLMYTRATTLAAHVDFPNEDFSSPGAGGSLMFGDGTYGAAVGYQSGPSRGHFGLGIHSPEVNMSLGLMGTRDFGANGQTKFNLGLIADPGDKVHLGATYMNFLNSAREWGLGLGYDFAPTYTMGFDLAASRTFTDIWGCPALIMRTANASLMIGYGFKLKANSASVTQIGDGARIGASIHPAQNLNFEFYYRRESDSTSYGYYFGLSYAFN